MSHSTRLGIGVAMGTALVGGVGTAEAAFIPPPGLNPGDHYRVVFTTAGLIAATSTNIATYNTFVTTEAAAGSSVPIGATWSAIASTETVNAVDNITCSATCLAAPIYRVDGVQVATSTADLFDGSILNPINKTQNGTSVPQLGLYVWTGSKADGTGATGAFDTQLGTVFPSAGIYAFATSQWITGEGDTNNLPHFLYAISGDLIVLEGVPEPGTVSILGFAALALGALRRRARFTACG